MKQISTFFLKGAVILIGLVTLAVCIFGLPQIIGSFSLGGYDPILLGIYITVIPFFIALFQALKLLNYVDKNRAFSEATIKALNVIKYCAIVIGAMYAAGMPYIFQVADKDDAPGVVLIGLVITGASFVVATFMAVLQKLLQNAIDIKRENDLTV
jgi:hypothetical protein